VPASVTAVEALPDLRMPGVAVRVAAQGTDRVTIYRSGPDGDDRTFWSGSPAPVAGGWAIAYDQEVRCGGYSYRAVAGLSSMSTTVYVPWVAPTPQVGTVDLWLKSLRRPHLSMPLTVNPPGDVTVEDRDATTPGWGWDSTSLRPPGPVQQTYTAIVTGQDQLHQLWTLLTAGGTLLLQTAPGAKGFLESEYGRAEGRSVTQAASSDHYKVAFTFRSQGRPQLGPGAPLRVPTASWVSLAAGARDLRDLAAAYPASWDMVRAAIGYRDADTTG